jgi:type I restriction enzyme S subunit
MNVLLSIRPEYAEAILSRKKKYEFRKRGPKLRVRNQKAYIYSSSPVCKIVASFRITSILESHPRTLWRKFGKYGGIDSRKFSEYFGSRERGYAIEIGSLKAFKPPIEPRKLLEDFVAPQSFRYVPLSWESSLPNGRF